MGELAEAESGYRYKAPWEGATPEEDFAYSQAVEAGNMDFEREVAQSMGPVGDEYIDADKATVIGADGWNVHGFYIPPEFDTDDEFREGIIQRYEKVMMDGDATLQANHVYAVGGGRAQSNLWSHEFRHMYRDQEDIPSGFHAEETEVRRFQAYRARTADEWFDSVVLWRDYLMSGRNSPKSMTLHKAEEHLKNTLETRQSQYLKKETEALKKRGWPPMKRSWHGIPTSSHKSDMRDELETRQKDWDIEKAVQYQQMEAREAAAADDAKRLDEAIKKLQKAIDEASGHTPELTDEQIENMIKG